MPPRRTCSPSPQPFWRFAHLHRFSGFKKHLASKPEPVHILSQGHFKDFDTVISEKNKKIGLTVEPEDMVFLD